MGVFRPVRREEAVVHFEWNASALGALLLLTVGFAVPLGLTGALLAAGLVFASLLLHELAHVAAVSRHGVPVKAIGITFKGAYTRREQSPLWFVEAQSALAGPTVNFLLYAIFSAMPGDVNHIVAQSNLIIGIFNLIPIRPSDGWRFMQSIAKR